MRCPKCHYLSFDPEPRCKNCGYDLEVADSELALRTAEEFEGDALDLPLRPSPAPAPPVTLELVHSGRGPESEPPEDLRDLREESEPAAPPPVAAPLPAAARGPVAPPAASAATAPALILVDDPPMPAPPAPVARPAVPSRSPHTTTDLPLFVKAMPSREETPAPRPPLAVRRAAPEVPRSAPPARRRPGPLDHDLLEDLRRVEKEEAALARADAQAILRAVADRESADVATSRQRLIAGAIDGLLLGGIGAAVLWATLRLCEVGLLDLPVLSAVPLALFLAGIAMSYMLLFTVAEGQTPGKMLAGIRVVNDEDDAMSERLGLGQATGRAVLALISVLPLGLGWIPALFGRGLALHDRLAHTRVVRA